MSVNNQQYNYQMPPQAPPPRPVAVVPRRQTKNKFLTFVLGCIPGVGQMYHGLMKKGISIMTLFFGIIGISVVSYLGVLNILLPVIWFYSFFDTVNRMNMSLEELSLLQDNYLFMGSTSPLADKKIAQNKTVQKIFRERHLILGWALILIACWIFLNMLFGGWYDSSFLNTIMDEAVYYAVHEAISFIPAMIVPVICVVIGVKLIRGDKPAPKTYNEYTVPEEPETADEVNDHGRE